jgi:general secretion pathway protein D
LGGEGIGGLPIISTRQIKSLMRLRDGETNLLAGLLKDTERMTFKGIPGLKDLPVIGKLFSYTDQEITQTDVVMTITPYIIRSLTVEDEELSPLWLPLEGISGGGAGRLPRANYAAPTGGQEDMLDVIRRDRAEETQGANRIRLSPPGFETGAGREVRINVTMISQDEVQNMTVNFAFNPEVLRLKSVIRGNVLSRLGADAAMLENIDNASGACIVGFTSPQLNKGFQGSGSIVTLVFEALAPGETQVAVSSVSANSVTGGAVQFDASSSNIRIR